MDKKDLSNYAEDTKTDNKKGYILPLLFTLAWFYVSTLGANVLNSLPYLVGYILFVLFSCIVIILWIWNIQNLSNRKIKHLRVIQISSTILAILMVVLLSPSYIDLVVKKNNTIQMPDVINKSTNVTVSLGFLKKLVLVQL